MSTVVIGAGISGLAAARRLQEEGEEAVILEAHQWIGGRTRSLRDVLLHDQPADLGASLIDLGQDLLFQVCRDFGLRLTPETAIIPADADGSVNVSSLLRTTVVLGGERLDQAAAAELADEVRRAVDTAPPLETETVTAWTYRVGLSDPARRAVEAQTGFIMVNPAWRTRMKVLQPPATGARVWMLADGTDSIAQALADGLDIRLEQVVRRVARKGRKVSVETDGDVFEADDAVVAVPITPTLRIGFDPVLPSWKVNALLATPTSQGGKIIGQYSNGRELLERLGHAALSDGPISFVWPRPVGPEDTIVLLGLATETGDGLLDDQERALTALDDLVAAVAGPGPRRVAGYAQNWTADEFAGGVTSGTWTDHPRLTAQLAQSVGPFHFAGEHTDDVFTTGMEGALRSGLRVADEVLERRQAGVGSLSLASPGS